MASEINLPYDEPHSHPPDPDRGEPGVVLTDHLVDVGRRAGILSRRGNNTTISEITRIAGELHDFGKVTPFFQFHIAGNTPTPESLKNHSPLGALAIYHVLTELDYDEELALVGLIAIAKHHGVLPNVVKYVNDTALGGERHEQIDTQLAAVDRVTVETADAILTRASGRTTGWDAFYNAITTETLQTTIKKQITRSKGQLDLNACTSDFYDGIIQVWGALVIADKTSAARIGTEAFDASYMHSDAVDGYVGELQAKAEAEGVTSEQEILNEYRDQARENIVKSGCAIATAAGTDGWVGEITLPTGLGKTLAALHLAHAIGEERNEPARIIYALPYTSIIDQIATVMEDVFNVDKTTNELTIHHSLEETVTQIEEHRARRKRNGLDPDQYASEEYLLAKGWNSGMTLTTFVQLFESLVRPSNQQAMKLPALYNSVIILDEPQTLPLDWWRLIRRIVQTLVDEYDATVISMTATPPRILTEEACSFEVHELVDDPDQYFEFVERVEYHYHHSLEAYLADPEGGDELSHEAASETIIANLSDEEPTGLAICNTVASAIALTDEIDNAAAAAGYDQISLGEVYDEFATRDDDAFSPNKDETITECRARMLLEALDSEIERARKPVVTLHLTTRHRPKDRKVLLEAASTLSDARDVPFVFVATQLVEAGVDVSFTRVYRDFAPMSSIVQAAGRCNRSAERDRGTVTIWCLEKTETAPLAPSQLIYGIGQYNKLEPTARALGEVAPQQSATESRHVREIALAREGVEEYYRILDEERDVGTEEYVEWVDTAKFEKLRTLSLIDERAAFDVIVCRSHEENDRVDALIEALDAGSFATAREHLSALEEAQVSLPESEVRGKKPLEATPIEIGERLLFVVDEFAGNGDFSPRIGLRS